MEDADGGRVFLRGELVWAWDAGDTATRCLAAVQLWRVKAARLGRRGGVRGGPLHGAPLGV